MKLNWQVDLIISVQVALIKEINKKVGKTYQAAEKCTNLVKTSSKTLRMQNDSLAKNFVRQLKLIFWKKCIQTCVYPQHCVFQLFLMYFLSLFLK